MCDDHAMKRAGGRARLLGLAALWLWAVPAFAQDESPAIQRYLGNLRLGDTLEDVQRVYPPAQEWPALAAPRGGVTRIKVERENAKKFPPDVDILWLGFRKGHLVEIQLIYDARFSRKRSSEVLAERMSLVYGDPNRSSDKFWWSDGSTVLRVFGAELPTRKDEAPQKDEAQSLELRTSIQIMERGLFRRLE